MRQFDKLPLIISEDIPIPLNLFLKEQIKYLIVKGILQPGDYLPNVHQLGDQLGINRNTVNSAYTLLKDEQILLMGKGKRTQISSHNSVHSLKETAVHRSIEQVVKDSVEQGYTLEQFLSVTYMYSQYFIKETKVRILFIECNEHDYHFYFNQLVNYLPNAEIELAFIHSDDLNHKLRDCSIIITTLNHSEELRRIVSPQTYVYTIGATLEPRKLVSLSKIKPESKVSFMCFGEKGSKWMSQKVNEAGINQFHISHAHLNMPEHELEFIYQHSDFVFISEGALPFIKQKPNHMISLPLTLEETSIHILKGINQSL